MNQDQVVGWIVQAVVWAVCGVAALFAISLVGLLVTTIRNRSRLNAALREYDDLLRTHGAIDAKERCPHRVFTVGQTDYAVVTAADKWCRACGKHLGAASLKKSFWGNTWE